MTRMPMGHCCAPKIQQIITSTLAGHVEYSKDSMDLHGFDTSKLDIYLDGIRYCGTEDEVSAYELFVDDRAKKLDITFKTEESSKGTNYNFLGLITTIMQRSIN